MGIMISRVRIKNYRSIESLDLELSMFNLLIGQNNTGKSNFLRAINTAILGTADISESDIYIDNGERLEKSKTAIIDLLIKPTNADNAVCNDFTEFWTSVFTETWITTSDEGSFVGIRTEIKYDVVKNSYILNRRCIRQWRDSIDTTMLENRKVSYNEDMRTLLQAFYMDANRDIVQDMRNRKSYFGRITSNYDLTEEKIRQIEEQLSSVNTMIIDSIPALTKTKKRISAIGKTIGSEPSTVEVEPIARKISDINKGMDIVMKDGTAAMFPISQHGDGTRSWISFLTLSAFVENEKEKRATDTEDTEQYIMLTMEEPEAHLHPQAQRLLFEQISDFSGQKIVSTHSPSIVAQSALADTIHFCKRNGKTQVVQYRTGEHHADNTQKTFREVLNTRAEFLFASAVILCEGITEEIALPVFFQEYFGCAPYALGVSIINICGKDNYVSFLTLAKDFDIPWFIFSDGEPEAIDSVRSAVRKVFDQDFATLDQVIILDNGDDYEEYLINAGYSELIISAICEHENGEDFFESYKQRMQGQKQRGGGTRDYNHANGRIAALIDLCHGSKTEYALPVAQKLISQENSDQRIPPKIKHLFTKLAKTIGRQRHAVEGETT
jgi:putative ATP-dependent endonuclease of OLD family